MPLVGFALGFGLLRTVALAYFVGGACEFVFHFLAEGALFGFFIIAGDGGFFVGVFGGVGVEVGAGEGVLSLDAFALVG